MGAQTLITGALVVLCSAWAAWMLLPAGLRARCRARMGLQAGPASGGCGGCSGCAAGGGTTNPARVVKLVRRPRA